MTQRSWWPVVVALSVFGVLMLVAGQYGFHRDELYFVIAGRHPALGYVDQPPFTPLVSAAAAALLGATPVAIRILPALVVAVSIVLSADMARRFGGRARAQVIAAVCMTASGLLTAGHLDSTGTFDVFAWTVVLWLGVMLLDGGDRRLWPVLGIVAGVGLENKHLMLFLLVGLAAGVVLARRWDVLRSPWAWSAAGLALLVWLPNLAWQAANGWPQLEMARAIAENAVTDRGAFVVEVLLLAGSLVAVVPIVGTVRLLVSPAARPWQAIGWASLVILAIVVAVNGKSYYAVGTLAPLVASGAVAVDAWLAGRWPRLRAIAFGAAAAVSIAVLAVLTLPIVPAASLASTPIVDIYKESAEQIGWPELVAEVRDVAGRLTPDERANAIVITSNYGEAGALEVLGDGLPPVYSGHNSYWDWGPPPDGRSVAIVVAAIGWNRSGVGGCTQEGRVNNGLGIPNEEQGTIVSVCRNLPSSWADAWHVVRHLD